MHLFHITSREEWSVARAAGEYRPRAFVHDGFIHCSYAGQVVAVANRFYRGVADLVLLEIDPGRLTCAVVEENLEGGEQLFPHIYGALPVDAVVETHAFACDADGAFSNRSLHPQA